MFRNSKQTKKTQFNYQYINKCISVSRKVKHHQLTVLLSVKKYVFTCTYKGRTAIKCVAESRKFREYIFLQLQIPA